MKTITSVLVALVLGLGLMIYAKVSSAYTIDVECQINPVPPPTRPYQNVDCDYSWQSGGNPLATTGDWTADLVYRGTIVQPAMVLLHELQRIKFAFANTSPESTYILCTNQGDLHESSIHGRSFRLVIGGTSGGTYWSIVESDVDSAVVDIDPPLVTCS